MKLIITGGSGFIGTYVVQELKEHYNLHVIGRDKENPFPNRKNVSYWQSDYSLLSLEKIFSENEPDAVIHLAAKRPDGKDNFSDFIENISTSARIFEVCLNHCVQNIVNISTQSVYSATDIIPWSEDFEPTPASGYGFSKKCVEQAADFFNRKGLFIKTLRVAQVIGLSEREGYVLQTFLKNSLNQEPLTVYGTGMGKRHYIYVKDVVAAIKKALDQPEMKGVFNIGMKKNHSFNELAETINDVFENKAGIDHLEDKPAAEQENIMSIKKAKYILNWEPRYSLEDAFRDVKRNLE